MLYITFFNFKILKIERQIFKGFLKKEKKFKKTLSQSAKIFFNFIIYQFVIYVNYKIINIDKNKFY